MQKTKMQAQKNAHVKNNKKQHTTNVKHMQTKECNTIMHNAKYNHKHAHHKEKAKTNIDNNRMQYTKNANPKRMQTKTC